MVSRFITDTGIEVPGVTTAQMREVDRIAVEETGPNLFQMMEHAGRNLALVAIEILGKGWNKASVVVLAGPGGNGGGGICAARHLANRNMDVRICLADSAQMREVPAYQRKIFQLTGGKEAGLASLCEEPADLILDALIGYGLNTPPRRTVAKLIQWANGTGTSILALDLPSGLDATTGEAPGDFIRPRWTMTLALPKTGLLSDRTGDLILADIGIPEGVYRRLGLAYKNPFDHRFYVPLKPVGN